MNTAFVIAGLTSATLLCVACTEDSSTDSTAVPPTIPVTLPASGNTPPNAGVTITPENAAQLTPVNRATIDAPQGMTWRVDSSSLLVYTNGTLEELPALPDAPLNHVIAALPQGERIVAVNAKDEGGFLTLAGDRDVNLRDLRTSEVLNTIQEHAPVSTARFAPDGARALIQRLDKTVVKLVSLPDGGLIKEVSGFETAAPVYSARFSTDGKSLIWLSRATVQVMDVMNGELSTRIERPESIGGVALLRHADEVTLATAEASQLHLWDADDGRELRVVPLPAPAADIAVSRDMALIVVATPAGLQILDASLMTVASLPGGLRQVTFSPDGSALATIDEAGEVVIWKVSA